MQIYFLSDTETSWTNIMYHTFGQYVSNPSTHYDWLMLMLILK